MKKSLTINLNGCVYQIDEDAYIQLNDYLESLKVHLSSEKGSEDILADIEARIAELFSERIRFGGLQVMTIKEVNEIVATLGHPEDFEIEHEEEEQPAEPAAQPQPRKPERLYRNMKDKIFGGVCSGLADHLSLDVTMIRALFVIFAIFGGLSIILYLVMWIITPRGNMEAAKTESSSLRRRRLYRNSESKMIGGVCSGLGEYFNVDVTIFRILFVLMLFLWGGSLVLYLLLWIITPLAVTSAQKLELKGIEPTVENIKRHVQTGIDKGSDVVEGAIAQSPNFFQRIFNFFGEVFSAIFKLVFGCLGGCLGCVGAVILIPMIIGLTVGAIALLFKPVAFGFDLFQYGWHPHWMVDTFFNPINIARTIIAIITVVGIPLLTLIYVVVQRVFKLKPISKTLGWILFIVWLAGAIFTGVFAFQILQESHVLIPAAC